LWLQIAVTEMLVADGGKRNWAGDQAGGDTAKESRVTYGTTSAVQLQLTLDSPFSNLGLIAEIATDGLMYGRKILCD
jgi:hypothetical protein